MTALLFSAFALLVGAVVAHLHLAPRAAMFLLFWSGFFFGLAYAAWWVMERIYKVKNRDGGAR